MNLRSIRQQMKLSIDEIARRSGVERSRISRAERGYVALQAEEIRRLAAVVSVEPSVLVVYAPVASGA